MGGAIISCHKEVKLFLLKRSYKLSLLMLYPTFYYRRTIVRILKLCLAFIGGINPNRTVEYIGVNGKLYVI